LKYGSDRHTEFKGPRKQNVFKGFFYICLAAIPAAKPGLCFWGHMSDRLAYLSVTKGLI
jgi:hypothetical protein